MDYILKAKLACLSTDEKPTTIPGYTDDLKYSILYELDTDKKYYYNGEEWLEIGTSPAPGYLLNKQATGTWTSEGGQNFYNFVLSDSDYDQEALAALRNAVDGGATPSLVLTCEELDISNVIVPHVGEYFWQLMDGYSIAISLYDNQNEIAIVAQSQGATITATLVLSVDND